jgi:hypothetical protein
MDANLERPVRPPGGVQKEAPHNDSSDKMNRIALQRRHTIL